MAKKKKSAASKVSLGRQVALAARIRSLERRLQELERNPVLALADVVVLEKGRRRCSTVKIVGNLQIVNGMGKTDTTNGCGNLIIGYNEPPSPVSGAPDARTGSHNLIIGRFHSHASYACLVAGEMNAAFSRASSSCVVGGSEGHVDAAQSVVVGGRENKANSEGCVIIGGFDNGANGANLSVAMGGTNNRTAAERSSVFGGFANTTNGSGSTILGGTSLSTTMPGERIP